MDNNISMKYARKRISSGRWAILLVCSATFGVISSAASATGLEGMLRCSAHLGNQSLSWQVEINDNIPLAIVDEQDTPAEYSASHVRVRLEMNGPELFIGRMTGKMVLSAPDGKTMALGQCSGGVMT